MFKVEIYVKLKKDVLDPQGKAIKNSAANLGYKDIIEVSQGKYFEVIVKNSNSIDNAKEKARKLSKNLLVNEIIEEYKIIKVTKV